MTAEEIKNKLDTAIRFAISIFLENKKDILAEGSL